MKINHYNIKQYYQWEGGIELYQERLKPEIRRFHPYEYDQNIRYHRRSIKARGGYYSYSYCRWANDVPATIDTSARQADRLPSAELKSPLSCVSSSGKPPSAHGMCAGV